MELVDEDGLRNGVRPRLLEETRCFCFGVVLFDLSRQLRLFGVDAKLCIARWKE